MSISISDGTNSITIRPYRIGVTYSHAVEFGLGYAVSIYEPPESEQYDLSAYMNVSDISTLRSMNTSVTVTNNNTNAYPEIVDGEYLINRIEVRGEYKYQNVRDVNIRMVKVP